MATHYLLCIFLATCLFGCGGSVQQQLGGGELDYTQIENATGWRLKIYGNGSGSISHEQLPAHHLHYPRSTFPTLHLRQRQIACAATENKTPCARILQYSALKDTTYACPCVDEPWTQELMMVAIDRMEYAVEAGGSERSCRMLRRHWLDK